MSQHKPLSLSPVKPTPPPAQRKRPWAAVFLVLILAGAAAWLWVGKDPAKREALMSAAKEAVSETSKHLSGAPSPTATTPTHTTGQTTGQSQGQTQGQTPGQVQGLIQGQQENTGSGDTTASGLSGTPAPLTAESGDAEGRTTRGLVATDPQQPLATGLAGRKDDAVVRPVFIDDLARWMVDNYTPASSKGGKGNIGIGIQSANARYGVGMKGLAWIGDDLPAGRAEALRHVYTPNMLDALYRMYIDRFMQAMTEASMEPRKNGKPLEPEQLAEMYRLYAGRMRTLSGAMQGVAALEDLRARVSRIREASQKMVAANTHYVEEVFKFDQARESDNQTQIEKTRASMEAASDVYRQAAQERDQLRDALIGAIRNNPSARGLSDDSLFYVALWIDRRLQQSPQALDASLQGGTLFLDLAQRFEQEAGMR